MSEALSEQLSRVPPSLGPYCGYRPCRVTLRSGQTDDVVYIAKAESYIAAWGVRPEDDAAKRSVSIADVVDITESPRRLPATFANRLYDSGESGMGYSVFTVCPSRRASPAVCHRQRCRLPRPPTARAARWRVGQQARTRGARRSLNSQTTCLIRLDRLRPTRRRQVRAQYRPLRELPANAGVLGFSRFERCTSSPQESSGGSGGLGMPFVYPGLQRIDESLAVTWDG